MNQDQEARQSKTMRDQAETIVNRLWCITKLFQANYSKANSFLRVNLEVLFSK